MTSRRPPSLRDTEYAGRHQGRQLQSMSPGAVGGRLASAAPIIPSGADATFAVSDTGSAGAAAVFKRDRFSLASSTPALDLTYLPMDNSLHVYLNGLEQDENADYTLSGQTVSVLTAMDAVIYDVMDCRYAYLTDVPAPVLPDVPSFADVTTGGGAMNFTMTLPTVFAGQLIVVCCNNDRNLALVTPSGWTKHASADQFYCHVTVFSKVSDGTETTFLVSDPAGVSSGATADVVAIVYDSGTVQAAATGTHAAGSFAQPTVATNLARIVLHASCAQTGVIGVGSVNLGADVTDRGGHHSGTLRIEVGDFLPGIVGTSPVETATADTVGDNWAGVTVAIGIT